MLNIAWTIIYLRYYFYVFTDVNRNICEFNAVYLQILNGCITLFVRFGTSEQVLPFLEKLSWAMTMKMVMVNYEHSQNTSIINCEKKGPFLSLCKILNEKGIHLLRTFYWGLSDQTVLLMPIRIYFTICLFYFTVYLQILNGCITLFVRFGTSEQVLPFLKNCHGP